MNEEQLEQLKERIRRADELKRLIGRLDQGIEHISAANAVMLSVKSGDFYLPQPDQVISTKRPCDLDFYKEIDGSADAPGMAADIMAAIMAWMTNRKETAERELSQL